MRLVSGATTDQAKAGKRRCHGGGDLCYNPRSYRFGGEAG